MDVIPLVGRAFTESKLFAIVVIASFVVVIVAASVFGRFDGPYRIGFPCLL